MNALLGLAKNILTNNFKDPRYPYRFTYILTYRCQFKCRMCNIWDKPIKEEISLAQIKKFFEKSNRFYWINLSGGEIFLRPDLPGIIDALFKNCRQLFLLDFPTNGFQTGLIVDTVKKILNTYRPPKLLVTVSLDGPRQVHERLRNVEGSWERAVGTFRQLRNLRSRRFEVFFGMTLQPENRLSFKETLREVDREIGGVRARDFHVNLIQHSQHYYGNTEKIGQMVRDVLREELERISALRDDFPLSPVGLLERRYQRLAGEYLEKGLCPLPCQALSASFFMDPTGNVYPCSVYDRPIGNIKDFDYDIRILWDTKYRKQIREEIRQGSCPQCWTPCEAYQSILASLLPLKRRIKVDQRSIS